MNCPSCELEMREYDVGDLLVDICSQCGGVWFDSGELKPFMNLALTERKDIPYGEYSEPGDHLPPDELEDALLDCPRCGSPLEKFNYAYDSNILLERCSDCEGLWSDRDSVGELASFLKGDPKADRLHAAMLRFNLASERFRNGVKAAKYLSRVTSGSGGGIPALPPLPKPRGGLMFPPNYNDMEAHAPKSDLLDVSRDRVSTWMVIAIVAINSLIYGMYVFGRDGSLTPFGLIPESILSGAKVGGIFSYMFVHPSMILTFVNGSMLWFVAREIEKEFGHTLLLLGYILSGLLAGALHVATNLHSSLSVVGSAGAVAGVVGFYVGRYPFIAIRGRVTTPFMDLPPIVCVVVWLCILFAFKLLYADGEIELDVGWLALAGTAALGIVFGRTYASLNEVPGTR